MPLLTRNFQRAANVEHNIIGIDPGKTTGVVVLEPTGRWTLMELDTLSALWDLLLQVEPKTIVCEKFVWQPRVHDITAVEYIGVTKLYVQQRFDVTMIYQTPSAAKNFVTDTLLRRNGMFDSSKGMRHARDAKRHVIYYLVHRTGDKSWLAVMK